MAIDSPNFSEPVGRASLFPNGANAPELTQAKEYGS
jgi:hypothetical protein